MKLKSYKEYLGMVEEAIEKAKIPFKVRKAEKEIELKIITAESDVASLESNLQALISSKEDLNISNILNTIDDIELAERKVRKLNELKDTLFPKPSKRS